MGNYYFLASLLPELEIGHLPSLSFPEFMELVHRNLSSVDQRAIEEFLRFIDFENFRAFWSEEPLDSHGNLSREQIESSLTNKAWPNDEPFPSFLIEFLERYHENHSRVAHFPELMSQFYQYQSDHAHSSFVSEYSQFQRELALVLIGFRAKLIGRDLVRELQYEDSNDPIVAQLIAQKDAKSFEPPFEYKELKPIFEEFQERPLELYKEIIRYQFKQIIERWGAFHFSLERILNYLARLILVEKWMSLDVQKGMEVVDIVEGKIR